MLTQLNSIDVHVTKLDKIHRHILFTSGIKKYFKHLNPYNFILIMVVGFLLGSMATYQFSQLIIPSILLGAIMSIIPLIVLDMMVQKQNESLSHDLVTYISLMSRWAAVNDDIFYCFEKANEQFSGVIYKYIKDFLIQVKYSGSINYAFDMLLIQSDNEMFRNFIINLRQAEICKGNLCELLERLEDEAYQIEGEYNRRHSETFFDRMVILITIVLVLVLAITVLSYNEPMRAFYLHSTMGQYLLSIYAVLFVLGIFVASRITTFNY